MIIKRFASSQNQWLNTNFFAWTWHLILVIEACVLLFWGGAWIFGLLFSVKENFQDKKLEENDTNDLAEELSHLRKFMASHFKDTCSLCSKMIKPDDMVLQCSWDNNHAVGSSCYATHLDWTKNWHSKKDVKSPPQKGVIKGVPFAEILAKREHNLEWEKENMKLLRRKLPCVDF